MAASALFMLAGAPFDLPILAWLAFPVWLLAIRHSAGWRSVFWATWIGGTAFFGASLWWLGPIMLPGAIALVLLLGVVWSVFALLSWREWQRWRSPWVTLLLTPVLWVAVEWLRSNLFTGMPWVLLAHTQASSLPVCQIADTTGELGVSFLVALGGTALSLLFEPGLPAGKRLAILAVTAAAVLSATAYGFWRLSEPVGADTLSVCAIQSNIPQNLDSWDKGMSEEDMVKWHLDTTRKALAHGTRSDVALWSETILPAINPEARTQLSQTSEGPRLDQVVQALGDLAREHRVSLVVGGSYWNHFRKAGEYILPTDKRNSAYLVEPDGRLHRERYDKTHLVVFGEYLPFKESLPPAYDLFMALSPYDFDHSLTPGSSDHSAVFPIPTASGRTWRVVTPICFEDVVSRRVRPMIYRTGMKRADAILNLTNDGWFRPFQQEQHLSAAVLRCIENRVPMVRCVNTGISAAVDSSGRVLARLAFDTEGTLRARVASDPRETLFGRVGDLLGPSCFAGAWILTLLFVLKKQPSTTAP